MKIVGYIARRRCIGRNLAFADIEIEETLDGETTITTTTTTTAETLPGPSDGGKRTIQVVFQRESSIWNNDFDSTFPNKNSKLPHGGKVLLEVYLDERVDETKSGNDTNPPDYLVRQWELLESPHQQAMEQAKSSEGISCTTYLKCRGDAFLRFNDNSIRCQPKPGKAVKEEKDSGEFSHGDNRAKALRAKIFASWLIETYGQSYLQSGGGVLDVAGGKGKLSVELAIQGQIPCTIVDPLVRKHGIKMEPRDARRIRQVNAPHPQLLAKYFNKTDFLDDNLAVLNDAQICVGLHPDECTEDIVDVALEHGKPLAIVPCCIFSGFFPLRTIQHRETGELIPVRTYEDFVDYLLAKDERFQKATLPFEGRNIVIYRLP